jgi:hypothetical protein
MRNTSQRVFIGDIVTTKKGFKPVNKSGVKIDLKDDQFTGMVVARRGDFYGVRFGYGLDFTDKLDGLLSNDVGAMLKRDDFEIEPGL